MSCYNPTGDIVELTFERYSFDPLFNTSLFEARLKSQGGVSMNEEQFNLDLRKFLKRFGISAQREIEEAVRKGLADGSLTGAETLKARARLEIEGRQVDLVIEEDIHLG
jgi:hypothetical protein